ncbi:MAG: hypothetical protein M3294_03220 [Pseudomonadota bacterium]|nr:hypothetical protein [Pseudomonadota bacterium]
MRRKLGALDIHVSRLGLRQLYGRHLASIRRAAAERYHPSTTRVNINPVALFFLCAVGQLHESGRAR